MPLVTQSAVGSDTVVPGVANKVILGTSVLGGTVITDSLLTNQLPNLTFYIRQKTGGIPCTVTPEFAVRRATGAAGLPILDFLPLSNHIVLPALNVPLILTFTFPCTATRLQITGVAGQTSTFDLILGSYGP